MKEEDGEYRLRYTVGLTLQIAEGGEVSLGSWDPNPTTEVNAQQLSHGARDTLAQFGVRDVVRVTLTVQPPFVLWNEVNIAPNINFLFYMYFVAQTTERWAGFCVDLMEELAALLNITAEYRSVGQTGRGREWAGGGEYGWPGKGATW